MMYLDCPKSEASKPLFSGPFDLLCQALPVWPSAERSITCAKEWCMYFRIISTLCVVSFVQLNYHITCISDVDEREASLAFSLFVGPRQAQHHLH